MDKLETLIECLPNAPYKTLFAVEINALRAEVASLTRAVDTDYEQLYREEAAKVAALAKEVEKFEISYVLEQADHKRTSTELTAAQAREAKLRELWEAVEKEYFARLKEQDEEAAKFEAEKDMYGWNFHKGLRSGLVEFHIYMTKMVKALALPTDDSALQERLKEERERCAEMAEGATAYTQFQTVEHYKIAADALADLEQQVAAQQAQMYEDRRQALVWRDQVAALTKERDEDALLQPRITMSNLEMASALAAAQAREAKLHTMKDIAYRIVCDYARDNPIHEWMGVQQDPMGAHAWLEEFNNLLALPADDSALMERLKEERECVYVEMFNQGYINKQSLQQLQGA